MIQNRTKFALILSLVASSIILVVKLTAYVLTFSNAALSDAAESIVHLLAVSFVYYGLILSAKPADDNHHYGHERIEYISVGVEGTVIVIAGITIIYQAIKNYLFGVEISNLLAGVYLMGGAALVNFVLGTYLVRVGRSENNMIVKSNGKHTLTDVWTSLGVVVTLLIINYTGWMLLDSIVSFLLAGYIMYEGFKLLRYSVGGLMDERDYDKDQKIRKVLNQELPGSMKDYHNLRHRTTGNTTWVELHTTFNSEVSLQKAHQDATLLERRIMDAVDGDAVVTIHLEPHEADQKAHEILQGANKRLPPEQYL